MSNRVTCVLFVAALAGCGSTNRAIENVTLARAPELPADMLDQVDGLYKGEVQQVVARSPMCPTARWGTVEVGDRTLYFALTPDTIFIAPVQPNGRLRAETAGSVLDGELRDGRLRFAVANSVCDTRYDLRWVM